jgi:hypothetical protein
VWAGIGLVRCGGARPSSAGTTRSPIASPSTTARLRRVHLRLPHLEEACTVRRGRDAGASGSRPAPPPATPTRSSGSDDPSMSRRLAVPRRGFLPSKSI